MQNNDTLTLLCYVMRANRVENVMQFMENDDVGGSVLSCRVLLDQAAGRSCGGKFECFCGMT
jgi:hypothetical protein